MQAGGGYVGIHAATDTEYQWAWYGQMLGGYFRNHPAGTPNATVHIEDTNEPSTTGITTPWPRVDEWYNFQPPTSPVVNGGGNDYSPRDSGVKVLMTVDESTYAEDDGNTTDDDHPVTWCTDFDGGRAWYTALGHTQASYQEAPFRQMVLGGLKTAARTVTADCGAPRQAPPQISDFEITSLDDDTESPMELAVAKDGRVLYVERITGEINLIKANGDVVTAGTHPGLLGAGERPAWASRSTRTSTPPATSTSATRRSRTPRRSPASVRFTLTGDTVALSSERTVFELNNQREQCCHSSGSLAFDADGNLYIATGDNTNPFDSVGLRADRRARGPRVLGRPAHVGQHQLLQRQGPAHQAAGEPDRARASARATRSRPATSSRTADNRTLPEIFAMGFRNPFRITIDPNSGKVLLGDYGPDAGATDPNRGPQGSVEYNIVTPGNYGWPYCVRDNVPYNDYNFATSASGPKFNCAAPVNTSPNNTGLTNLPPAQPAAMWMGYTETDPRNPGLGAGGAPTGGPRYKFDPNLDSDTKFPAYYDKHWFIGHWNTPDSWIKTATLNANSTAVTNVAATPFLNRFIRPHEMEFGPDGSLYVIQWGGGFNGNNLDSGIFRIDYVEGQRRPMAHASATPDAGPVPLQVQFSSAGSVDPEGTSLTYAWDFDGNGTTDSTLAQPDPHLHHQGQLQRPPDGDRPGRADRRGHGRRGRGQHPPDGQDRHPRGRPVRRLR